MKNRITSKSFTLILVLVGSFLMEESFAEDKPNILFFLVDDMGVGDTSVPFLFENGKPKRIPTNDLYRTPNMERLAKKGRLLPRPIPTRFVHLPG